jgi:hypothetical protein
MLLIKYKMFIYVRAAADFMNNSERMDYSRTEVAAKARQ